MAANCDDLFDKISELSLGYPVSDVRGLEKLKSISEEIVKCGHVQDSCSVITGLDFSLNEFEIENNGSPDFGNTYVDIMPKVDLRGIPVKRINETFRNAVKGINFNLVFQKGSNIIFEYDPMSGEVVRNCDSKKCFIPVSKDIKEQNDIVFGYLVYDVDDGSYKIPVFGDYASPFLRFKYFNRSLENKIIREVYSPLMELSEDSRKI